MVEITSLFFRISYLNYPQTKKHHVVVGDEGLEPPASSLSVTRSNQLS